ncbi:MAG: MerR family transcriptional regulator [Gammaproteobacteria bacterium]|nr:MAG: MerR family transcriptional regulator [Gammaproteobacteria bacterium]
MTTASNNKIKIENEAKQATYSISDLSKEFDITTRSIRFYEDQGLISPTRKGQTRIYNQRDRVRLKLILRGKRLGFSLAETGRLFELYDADKSSAKQLATMMEIIAHKKSELNQQLDDIKAVLIELDDLEKNCLKTLAELENTTSTPKA